MNVELELSISELHCANCTISLARCHWPGRGLALTGALARRDLDPTSAFDVIVALPLGRFRHRSCASNRLRKGFDFKVLAQTISCILALTGITWSITPPARRAGILTA